MKNVLIRPGEPSDVDAIVALEQATGLAPHWPRAAYESALHQTGRRCLFVAENEATVVGFAVGALQAGSGAAARVGEIESVVVAQHARRAGVGRALCAAVLAWCRRHGAAEIVLEVRAGSSGAIALYAGLGFAQVGARPSYYQHPQQDALLMRMNLG